MNDNVKKIIAKKLVRLRANNDGLWMQIRTMTPRLTALAEKHELYDDEDMGLLRLCLGIVLSETLVNKVEVQASQFLTPDEDKRYGRTNT